MAGRGKPAYDIPFQLGARLDLAPERGGFIPRETSAAGNGTPPPGGVRLNVAGEAAGLSPGELLDGPAREVNR
jgi:hypothetical protein